ncbi:hypothetical protein BDK51DRAFT_27685 [Blyttiomyces helicus]|uniref:Uncharacterized protein n=1 Tax=Blyttiomyces helicus TaxID=388810 RepID=A0A4P9W903_9FUNG|nr:hypothetical protein BDK51DRAFT_27685 [Blyttiomyces helicus]|eukprot:RKO89019.1 hypothetical protein BDK51DRAFT_27685 [Blyttiomyces helicus]
MTLRWRTQNDAGRLEKMEADRLSGDWKLVLGEDSRPSPQRAARRASGFPLAFPSTDILVLARPISLPVSSTNAYMLSVRAQRHVAEKRAELAPIEGRTSELRAQVESLVSERERLRTYIDETHHRATQLAAALSAHRYREEAAARDLAALLDVFRMRSSALLEIVEALEGESADVDRLETAVKMAEDELRRARKTEEDPGNSNTGMFQAARLKTPPTSATEYRDTIDEEDDDVSRLANRLRSSDLTVAELEREADRLEKYILSVLFLAPCLGVEPYPSHCFLIDPNSFSPGTSQKLGASDFASFETRSADGVTKDRIVLRSPVRLWAGRKGERKSVVACELSIGLARFNIGVNVLQFCVPGDFRAVPGP